MSFIENKIKIVFAQIYSSVLIMSSDKNHLFMMFPQALTLAMNHFWSGIRYGNLQHAKNSEPVVTCIFVTIGT